jgi:dienelactone hydrolase
MLGLVLIAATLGTSCRHSGAHACSPFGNPPAKFLSNVIPQCNQGVRIGPWKDSDGIDRYACLYEPAQASRSKPLPMVVWLHPSLFAADILESTTNLLDYLGTANLSGERRPGFILLAPEGRNTEHYYAWPDNSGKGWDNWYRQFSPEGDVTMNGQLYRENVDAATIDHFIAAEEASGKIDPKRIYVSGWSNGAAMAYAYGLSRPKIAAIGVYSATDPYEMVLDPCPQTPVAAAPSNNSQLQIFNPHVPSYQIHNDCDIAGICPNVLMLESQLRALGSSVTDIIIDAAQNQVAQCNDNCGTNKDGDLRNLSAGTRGVANHLRWPKKWTGAMLDFFRQHPLSSAQ